MLTFLYSAALALSTTAGTSLLPASAVARLQPVVLQAGGAGGLTLQRAPPGGGIGGGDGGDDGNNGRGRGGGGGGDDDASGPSLPSTTSAFVLLYVRSAKTCP